MLTSEAKIHAADDSASWVEDARKQIGKLLSGELISFEVGDELAVPPHNRRMQRMNEQSFVRDIVHAEQITDALNIANRTSEKTPVLRVGLPGICVIAQNLRPVMDRVESDREQYEIFP